jgi:hypothetical protein
MTFDLTFITWNVLFRYHEEKYVPQSEVLKKFPDEANRINAQIALIKDAIENSSSPLIISLQEVPGDLMLRLKEITTHNLHICKHNRQVQVISTKWYTMDENEYLCTLIPKSLGDFTQESYEFGIGKSALILNQGSMMLINLHTRPGKDGIFSLNVTYKIFCSKFLAQDPQNFVVIIGDMNNSYDNILTKMSSHTKPYSIHPVSYLEETTMRLPKTPHSFARSGHTCDHILFYGNSNHTLHACIYDVEWISDHNIVYLGYKKKISNDDH